MPADEGRGAPGSEATTSAEAPSATEAPAPAEASSSEATPETTGGAIARAAAEIGATVGAKALVAFTMSGETARRLARYRSPIPLIAFTTENATQGKLSLTWGVQINLVPWVDNTDDMVRQVEAELLQFGDYTKGDRIVVVAGSPPGTTGSTNSLRVHRLGDAVALNT